jgi:hypothetical protein
VHLGVVLLLDEVHALQRQHMQQAGWLMPGCVSVVRSVRSVRAGCSVLLGVVSLVNDVQAMLRQQMQIVHAHHLCAGPLIKHILQLSHGLL